MDVENLDKALAALAEQLGIKSTEFVAWLTGSGLESYVRLHVARNTVSSVFWFVVIVALWRIGIYCHKQCKNDELTWNTRDSYAAALCVVALLGVFAAFAFSLSISNLIEWLVAPEGRIVEMLIGALPQG